MRRLFSPPPVAADVRPALLSIAALMMLLLPMLLLATSAQKLTGLTLSVPGPTEQLPPALPGPVKQLVVYRVSGGYQLEATVRNTDAGSSDGVDQKSFLEPTLAALQARLWSFKQMDPGRERVRLVPAADTPTEEVVRWMDAVRSGPEGPLFPRVVMDAAAAASESP